jgi:hypothetical protein
MDFFRWPTHYRRLMNTNTDVALILWNPDVIELVSLTLLSCNLTSSGLEPSANLDDLERFILSCAPTAVVLDLEPPYHRSARAAEFLLNRFPDRSFVLTCADPNLAQKTAPWLSIHPMFQKPYPMDALADKLLSMVKRSCVNAATVGS